MKLKVILLIVLVIAIGVGGMVAFKAIKQKKSIAVTNFIECEAAGYPVMESFPRRCNGPDGSSYTEVIVKKDLVRVAVPEEAITSPLILTGEAVGNWYFEASFPIVLLDNNGKEIATTIATAQGEWMTEDFVPFAATLTFTKPEGTTGTLLFKKDNPSGLPEHDNALSVPVKF